MSQLPAVYGSDGLGGSRGATGISKVAGATLLILGDENKDIPQVEGSKPSPVVYSPQVNVLEVPLISDYHAPRR